MARARCPAAAKRDLKEIWKFIAQENLQAADYVLDNIDSVLTMLGRSPLLDRSRDELAAGLRSFPVGNFVIFYVPRRGGITVVRVLSGLRDLPALFE